MADDDLALPPFVTPAWLLARFEAGRPPVLLDARWSLDGSQGEHTYRETHLPGGRFVDLDATLSASPTVEGGRHPLPDPARFAADLGALGVPDDVEVVAYDHGPGAAPARLVWMLRAIGQPAAVLDGGLAAWDGPVTTEVPSPTPVSRRTVPWPHDRVVDTDTVAALTARDDSVLLDAREPARFAGEYEPVDPRAGHVPGARNAPVSDQRVDGRLRDPDELRGVYAALGVLDAERVVAYCGSGVAACHDLLVLETLGIDGMLYPGSWSAWSADPGRPAELGPDRDR